MAMRIALIQGHPDASGRRYGHALAGAYAQGARRGDRELRRIEVAKLDFPVLRSRAEWETASPAKSIAAAQDTIRWAEHLVILYPLWLGGMPALLKAFFEQAMRPGFAIRQAGGGWERLLQGKSARIVVTMGMPASVYRWYFRAHGLKMLERNILGLCGVAPIRDTLIGSVEGCSAARRQRWLEKLEELGWQGA